ncbi:MAG: peptidoglycan editing factor PgeF [Spirochaetes bacterium]|nr:peptidoglycan editing factor PgeF [Spirochaetota bacterium]
MSVDPYWLDLSWSPHPQGGFPKGYISLSHGGDFNLRSPFHTRAIQEVGRIFPGKRFLYCRQEHTKIVRIVAANDEPGQLGDGLLTQEANILLGITVADCLPILLWDPKHQVRGLLHSGWKGTGILEEAVVLMDKMYGTEPKDLHVLLGPCIRSCCYRVDPERGQWFSSQFGEGASRIRNGVYYVDLIQANQTIAESLGIRSIEVVEGCTYCDTRFHSYRREGPSNFQRMLVLF